MRQDWDEGRLGMDHSHPNIIPIRTSMDHSYAIKKICVKKKKE